MFSGTNQQLINALNHMATERPITHAEKCIVAEAALRIAELGLKDAKKPLP
jgi:hypothetical protein